MTGCFIVKHPYLFIGSVILVGYGLYRASKAVAKIMDKVVLVTIELNKKEKENTTEEK